MTKLTIEEYLYGAEDKSNASESRSHQQMMTLFGSYEIRNFIMNNFLSPEAKQAHEDGLIYVHDSDQIGPYCNSIDPTIPLSAGLDLPTLKAYPASHLGSAIDHLYSFAMYSQGHFAGAQSMDWVNWFLAPYAYADRLERNEIKQELQKFFYNCNQITRTGGKPPFINTGIRFECPKPLQNRPVIFDGDKGLYDEINKDHKITYSHVSIQAYAEIIASVFMEILREGMKGGIPFTYPLVATTVTPDSDWDSQLWTEAFETMAHNGSLYIVNLSPDYMQADGGDEDCVSSQCCRVRVKFDTMGGIWSGGEMGTGSDKIITLNYAIIGYEARKIAEAKLDSGMFGDIVTMDKDKYQTLFYDTMKREFMTILTDRLRIIKETGENLQDMVRDSIYEWGINSWLAKETPSGIKYYDPEKRRLLVGTAFLHDMLVHMGFENGLKGKQGNEFAQAVIHFTKDIISTWMNEPDAPQWGIEAPPNESSNNHMVRGNIKYIRREYGDDKTSLSIHGTDDHDFEYAPATHVPYDDGLSLPEKIMAEAPFHKLCDGGNILLFFIGENSPHPEGVKDLVIKMCNTDLGYFALSPVFSICRNEHGTIGKHEECPKCGAEIVDYMQRITGYVERISKYHPSKETEWKNRQHYDTEGETYDA
jgi:ribonucleoside-triphosphate reductase